MKKLMLCCVIGAFVLLVPSSYAAIDVVSVEIIQDVGCTAQWTPGGVLRFSGGASGIIMTADPTEWDMFTEVEIEAEMQGLTDLSGTSGAGVLQGQFSSGYWNISMSTDTGSGLESTLYMAGQLLSPYDELEAPGGLGIDGRAVVTVDTAIFNNAYFGTKWGYTEEIEMIWGDGDGLAGMVSSMLFPPGTDLVNYDTGYLCTNASITLVADETSVPEPATMALLGLGALLLRKRRA